MVRAIRLGVLCALLSGSSGCGLLLDVDPPEEHDAGELDGGGGLDAGTDASVEPTDDAGAGDASSPVDSGVLDDAGDRDAGDRDGGTGTCRSSSECADSELCQHRGGLCYGLGTCVARPTACADGEPVCGCDWEEYPSLCDALASGANGMQAGACPIRVLAREWCALAPIAPADEGCGRCFDDADCPGTLASICVASSCHPGGEGICAFTVGLGDCYDARQCGETETCVGSVLDVCPSVTGRCEER